jgi:hypothetical protein
MPKCRLSIRSKSGAVRAGSDWDMRSILVFPEGYDPGDYILLEADTPGLFWDVRLEDSMLPAIIFMRDVSLKFAIPFGKQKTPYSPKSFSGSCHMITAKAAGEDQVYDRRNLALNPYDTPDMEGCYPHASDNIGPREEAIFIPRNAIDGIYANAYHWDYPYQNWGINRNPDAALKIDLEHPCRVDEVRLTLRADFPHDNYWVRATLDFSDGGSETISLEKSALPQVFRFDEKRIQWVVLNQLIPSDEPSPFPALTQIEIWGRVEG